MNPPSNSRDFNVAMDSEVRLSFKLRPARLASPLKLPANVFVYRRS